MVLHEEWTNGFNTTLSSAITSTSTGIGVAGVATLSTVGYSRFKIDNEIIGVGLNGTATWSTQVDRALEGTVAAAHTSGVAVRQQLTGGALNALVGVYGSTTLTAVVRDLNFTGGATVTLSTGPFSTGMVNIAIPGYSTAPTIVFSTAAAPGSTGVILRSDATLAVFDGSAPTTQAFGDVASSGSAAFAARRDHKHGLPDFSTGNITLSTGASAGSTGLPLRGDAVIAAFDGGALTTQGIGDSASSGSVAYAARRDHGHGTLTLPQLSRQTYYTGFTANPPNSTDISALFGNSSEAVGTSTQAFVGVLNTSGGSTAVWMVVSFGSTSWWRAALTLAT